MADTDTPPATPPEGDAGDPGSGSQEDAAANAQDDKTPEPQRSEVDQATEKHLTDLRKENGSWRRKLRDAEKQIETLTASSATEVEKARAEARQEAIAEATKDVNSRLLRAEVLVAATGRMANPEHAFAILNDSGTLAGFEPNEAGEFDRAKIAEAVDGLVKTTPSLGTTRDPDFGARPAAAAAQNTDDAFAAWLNRARR